MLLALLAASEVAAQEFRVHQYWFSNEEYGRIAPDAGDWVLSWDSDYEFPCTSASVMRALSGGGAFTTNDIEVFSCSAAGPACLAFQPTGAFAAVGTGLDTSGAGVYVRLHTGIGSPIGPEFLVNQAQLGWQSYAQVAVVSATSFVVVWGDENGVPTIKGRIVNMDGSMPGSEVVLPEPGGSALDPALAVSSARILATWYRYPSGPPYIAEAHARAFDLSLSPAGGETKVNQTGTGAALDVAPVPGGFLVTWGGHPIGAPQEGDLFARYVDLDGVPLRNEFVVNRTTGGNQGPAVCASDALGRSVLVFDSPIDPGGGTNVNGVYAQRVDAQGNLASPEFRANGMTFDSQGIQDVSMQPNGDFLILWGSYQDPNGSVGLYARRYSFPVSLLVTPGPGISNPPCIDVSRPDGSPGFPTIVPFAAGGFGANPGAGDVEADGLDEVLAGPGPSSMYGPHVRAFERDGTVIQKINFYAYGTLKYGVLPAGGRVDGDAASEILTTPGPGAVFGPHVRGWNYDGVRLDAVSKVNFFAYGTLKYGARSAGGDIDGDGFHEILTGPGPGPSFPSQVRGWDYDGTSLRSIAAVNFNAFSTGAFGATVSASDVESDGTGGWGDGYAEIIAGEGPDPAGSRAALFDYDGATVTWMDTVTPHATKFGVLVAGGDADAGDTGEVATAPGPDPSAGARVLVWDWDVVVGNNPDPPALHVIGPDDFTAFPGTNYGGSVVMGRFE